MDSPRVRTIAGLTARVVSVLAVLLMVVAGTVAAVQAHRTTPTPVVNSDAEYAMLGDRLREIRDLMLGTTLPPQPRDCEQKAGVTLQRLGLPMPPVGSHGWQIMIEHCLKAVR